MRGSNRISVVGLALVLCVFQAPQATAIEKEPVTGGLTATPGLEPPPAPSRPTAAPAVKKATPAVKKAAPAGATPAVDVPVTPAPAPEPAPADKRRRKADDTSWGVVLRGGYFGLPDLVLNKLFLRHPKVVGYTAGGEIRYHGDGGGRGVGSIGLAVDYGTTESEGIWQQDAYDPPEAMGGRVTMTAATVTGYLNLFPSWWVHPYVGFGLGAGYFEVRFRKNNKLDVIDTAFPIVHIPLGLAIEFGERLQFSLEARLLDGIAAGGSLQFRF